MGDNELDIIGDVFLKSVSVKRDVLFEDDGELIKIEMLRVGKFNSDVYGELDITHDMLDKMVDNFYDDVIGREVSFDWNHKAEKASAWLKEVREDNGVLIGSVEFTNDGKDSVSKKEFGYFSIEYADDYEDPESGDGYGPTILGGALTNRPFISNLKKIEFSMDNVDSSLYKLEEEKKMPKEKIERTPAKKADGDETLTLEELMKKNDELATKIKELEDKKEPKKEDKTEEGSKQFEDFIKAQTKQLETMEKKLETLEGENKKLAETSSKNASKARTSDIDRICDNLLTTDGHHPAVIDVAKEIMLGSDDVASIKLSETVGEGDDAETIDRDNTVMESVLKVLEAIPKSQRANYNEKSSSGDDKVVLEEEQTKVEESGMDKAFQKRGLKRKLKVVNGK